ncbi:para-nitrobenzyl esterase [Chitinophaga costaii]|uniref:Carboxylic ester hydrolase n=1 Tax=Chitinophaga costaii TaxID=1335309 RepID=A0A1C4AWG9_9BACT|nr:carboxylesterase family protein [Chitinophaga costaii]PUZ26772.1 carboxylesterase [Chitinophaga costaii]SCB98922.1 para-nitrobenzyl esterase [Chitinophaga costaii]
MKKLLLSFAVLLQTIPTFSQKQVTVESGIVEGVQAPGSSVIAFKGIPFAQPPVGDLRWKAPQAAHHWEGVLKADHFGPNPMQKNTYSDMIFRSSGMSEDCLYLNVWAPAHTGNGKLPVLVYFYGGGLTSGDGSEARYDGESMAKRGIIALTVNYRLGIFGFFSHPELTQESPNHASGNYGYLDQLAALQWVQKNIAAFGGDPGHVTIAGESAGSISVSVMMASPLSKHLIVGAIGESGAAIKPTLYPIPLAAAEQKGVALATQLHATTLAALRAMPAAQLQDSVYKLGAGQAITTIDGYLLPNSLPEIYAAGKQAAIPLLLGWNSAEVSYHSIMHSAAPTPENYKQEIQQLYGDQAQEALRLYPGNTNEEVIRSATALGSDRFIVYSTWKWADLHAQSGGHPVYRYLFSRIPPPMVNEIGNTTPGLAVKGIKGDAAKSTPSKPIGAPHAWEIAYAMGNLASNKAYAWTPADYTVSNTMESYFANFIKTGNPNGAGLPKWESWTTQQNAPYIDINVRTILRQETTRDRYLFLDKIYSKPE